MLVLIDRIIIYRAEIINHSKRTLMGDTWQCYFTSEKGCRLDVVHPSVRVAVAPMQIQPARYYA